MKLFRRILVPHDFSEHADRALAVAAQLAREHRGRLLVLHVLTPYQPVGFSGEPVIFPSNLTERLLEQLKARVARAVRGRGAPRVECRVVLGDPFHRIVAAARAADSIVMATAGRTGLSHALIGSVAEKVVRHATVPVLAIRPMHRAKSRAASSRPVATARRRIASSA
jgi:nucleotide-binding universal stress UspA family protein